MLEAGDSIIPCLVEKMIDTTPMVNNPTIAPSFGETVRVGDVAFFVILDITGREENIESFLPENIRDEYDAMGIYAYYRYVEDPSNREKLQDNVRQWLDDGK